MTNPRQNSFAKRISQAATRTKSPLFEANRLLEERDALRKKLGDEYTEQTAAYLPFVSAELKRCGCPKLAAARVLQLIASQQPCDKVTQRLVQCAAVDAALDIAPLSAVS